MISFAFIYIQLYLKDPFYNQMYIFIFQPGHEQQPCVLYYPQRKDLLKWKKSIFSHLFAAAKKIKHWILASC